MFPLFEIVKILDLDVLSRVTSVSSKADEASTNETEQGVDVLAQSYLKLYAWSDVGERSLLAVICQDGTLVVRYSSGCESAVLHRIDWSSSIMSKIIAMAFDPSGTWLLCASENNSLYILPILTAMDSTVKVNQIWNTVNITEVFTSRSSKAKAMAVVWWDTLDDQHIGILGNQLGEVVFIDLVKGKEVGGTYIPEQIDTLEIISNNEQSSTHLLVTSVSGNQWRLLLERKLDAQPRRPMTLAEKLNIFVRQRTTDSILNVAEATPQFSPIRLRDKMGKVSTEYAKSRYLLAEHRKADGIFQIYDTVDMFGPLFVYSVPTESNKVFLTDRLLYAWCEEKLSILSSQQSETSSTSRMRSNQNFKHDAVVQEFSMAGLGKILDVAKCAYPFYLHEKQEDALLRHGIHGDMGELVIKETTSKSLAFGEDILKSLKEKCDMKASRFQNRSSAAELSAPGQDSTLTKKEKEEETTAEVNFDLRRVSESISEGADVVSFALSADGDDDNDDKVDISIASGNLGIVRRGSSSENMAEVLQGAFGSLTVIRLLHHTVLTGCLIVTESAVYECRPRISPERMFLDLTLDNYESEVTEQLGVSLGLDLYRLYELAADFYLQQGQFCQAIYLYQLSKCPHVRVIANFVHYGHIGKVLAYVSNLMSNTKLYLSMADRDQLANIALLCFVHEVIEHSSSSKTWLLESFREFLHTTSNYDVRFALELLARYGMYDLLFLLAKRCGLLSETLEMLGEQGHFDVPISPERAPRPTMDGIHAIITNPKFLIQCMTSSDLIMQLLAHPHVAFKYMTLVLDTMLYLDAETLLHLAVQFDPSRAALKPFLSKATQHRKRSFTGSSSSVGSEPIDFIVAELEAEELIVEDVMEFYLSVLLMLHKKQALKMKTFDATFMKSEQEKQKRQPRKMSRTVIVPCRPVPLAGGYSHAAAIVAGELYTWGRVEDGRLGHQESIGLIEGPKRVHKLIGIDVKIVSCGFEHSVALTSNGVYAWGNNRYGQLGTGTTDMEENPVHIDALDHSDVVAIACGQYHTLTLSDTGRVYSCGWGVHGQLGHGSPEDYHLPTKVRALDCHVIVAICAGYAHSAALTEKGEVYTFGCAGYGQLGLGPSVTMKVSLPMAVSLPEPCTMLVSGYFHMVAVLNNSTSKVYTWGCSPQAAALRTTAMRRNGRQHSTSPAPSYHSQSPPKYSSLPQSRHTENVEHAAVPVTPEPSVGDASSLNEVLTSGIDNQETSLDETIVNSLANAKITGTDTDRIDVTPEGSVTDKSIDAEKELTVKKADAVEGAKLDLDKDSTMEFSNKSRLDVVTDSIFDNNKGAAIEPGLVDTERTDMDSIMDANKVNDVMSPVSISTVDSTATKVASSPASPPISIPGSYRTNDHSETEEELPTPKPNAEFAFLVGSPPTDLASLVVKHEDEEEMHEEVGKERKEEREAKRRISVTFDNSHMVPLLMNTNNITGHVKQISAGNTHTAILTDDGGLYTYGKNMDGQLGTGDRRPLFVPSRVLCLFDKKIGYVACGNDFSVAIDRDGRVYAWGKNENGEVGHSPGVEAQALIRAHSGGQGMMIKTSKRTLAIPSRAINIRLGVLRPQPVADIPAIPLASPVDDRGLIHLELPPLPQEAESEEWGVLVRQTLKRLRGWYNADRILQRCTDEELWDSMADVSEYHQRYPNAMYYRFKSLAVVSDVTKEDFNDTACSIVHHYIQECDIAELRGDLINPDWTRLIEVTLTFWVTHELNFANLEELLETHLEALAPQLAMFIISGLHLVTGEHVKLDERFSTHFCITVTSMVAEMIQDGNLSASSVKIILGQSDGRLVNDKNQLENGAGEVSSTVTLDRLWKEVLTSLGATVSITPPHVELSSTELDSLRQDGDGEAVNNFAVLFSCGHHFTQEKFSHVILPDFETRVKSLGNIPLQTGQLLVSLYKAPKFVPLCCPNCVLKSLEQHE